MEYSLPSTLQGLISGLLLERDILSWRIYGEKQVVVSIRFAEETRHEANYSTPTSLGVGMQQSSMAYRKKPPCSIARDRRRFVKWTDTVEQDERNGISPDLSTYSNNIDILESGANECVFTNNNMGDSGFSQRNQSLQYEDDDMPSTSHITVETTTDHCYEDKVIQCGRYDISTAPVHSVETQTSRAHKSRNIQIDLFPLKDKGTQSSVKMQSQICNTDITETTEKFTMTHRDALSVSCEASFSEDKYCQVIPNITTTGTSTNIVGQNDNACQTPHCKITSVSTMTEDSGQGDDAGQEYGYENDDSEQSYMDTDDSHQYYGQYGAGQYGYSDHDDSYNYNSTYWRPRASRYYNYSNYYQPP